MKRTKRELLARRMIASSVATVLGIDSLDATMQMLDVEPTDGWLELADELLAATELMYDEGRITTTTEEG